MILLDTNIVSEAMRPDGFQSVVDWMDARSDSELFFCTPVLAELRFGVEKLPKGRRRIAFEEACRQMEFERFRGRILPLDDEAAHVCGRVRARRKAAGRPINPFDAMIAAIALRHNAGLATRNIRDFEELDLELLNPFTDAD